jgi:hypothetical protein
VNRQEVIKLLESEKWSKADAIRALEGIDFSNNPDELTIRRAISPFAGSELIKRQRLQSAQKGLVTKKAKEIEQIAEDNSALETRVEILSSDKEKLINVNNQLKKDNKDLKNLVDAIRLRLAMDTKKLLQYKDSEIRKAVVKLFQSTLG